MAPPGAHSYKTGADADDEPDTLQEILAALETTCEEERVSVGQIFEVIGRRSFPALILVPALLLVSPLSGIPGTPTIGAMIFILLTTQALLGLRHVWLPEVLRRRTIRSKRVLSSLAWLEKPAVWVDNHTRRRWSIIAQPPFSLLALVATLALAAALPFLELFPLVTSVASFAIALLMIGKIARDGIFMIAGYTSIALCGALILALYNTVVN